MNWRRFVWWGPPCVLRTVVVNMKHDEAFALRGVLWGTRGPWLTLRRAELLKDSGPPRAIDGEAVVHRDAIAFLQVEP